MAALFGAGDGCCSVGAALAATRAGFTLCCPSLSSRCLACGGGLVAGFFDAGALPVAVAVALALEAVVVRSFSFSCSKYCTHIPPAIV